MKQRHTAKENEALHLPWHEFELLSRKMDSASYTAFSRYINTWACSVNLV